MGLVITSLSFLGYSLYLRKLIHWPIVTIPFLLTSLIVLLFYIFAYIGILQWSSLLVIGLGALLFVGSPFYLPKNSFQLFNEYFTLGFCLYLFFMITFGVITLHYGFFVESDDLFWWMAHSKLLHFHHYLIKPGDTILHRDYPPGGSLLCYYFLRLSSFSEAKLFYAHLIFLFSPVIILLQNFRWSETYNAFILSFLLILSFIFVFEVPLGVASTTLMDFPVGIFFGGMLASYIMMRDQKGLWLYLMLTSMAMILLRPLLYPFILMIAGIILFDQFILNNNKNTFFSKLLFIGIIIGPILINQTWLHYIDSFHFAPRWSLVKLFYNIYHQNYGIPADKINYLIENFLKSSFKGTVFSLVMLILTGILLLFSRDKEFKIHFFWMQLFLFLGFYVYLTLLLLIYLYHMETFPALVMECLSRFIYTYQIGWFVVFLAHTTKLASPKLTIIPEKINAYFKLSLLVVIVVPFYFYEKRLYENHWSLIAKRVGYNYNDSEYIKVSKLLLHKLNASKSVAITFLNINNKKAISFPYEDYSLAYNLFPLPVRIINTSLSKKLILQQLEGIDNLIVINNINDDFWRKLDWRVIDPNPKPIATLSFRNYRFKEPSYKFVYLFNVSIHNEKLYLTIN